MSSKDICIIAYWHLPGFKKKEGGLIRMYELGNNLTKFGHNVVMILPKIGFPRYQTTAKVVEVPFLDCKGLRPITFYLLSSLILSFIMFRRIDFLYMRQMNSFLPFVISKIFKVTSFYEIPNDPYIQYENSKPLRRCIESFTDKHSMRLSDYIVVLSEWSKQRIVELGRVKAQKIIVMPSGTDTGLFKPMKKNECRNKIKIDPYYFYVGFVGSFFSYQGIETLIEAAPSILNKFSETKFLLIGHGPMVKQLKEKIYEKGLNNEFIVRGPVPYVDVPYYIGAMDICVAPHLKNSNQASPVKIFDYMACQRAIVASNIPSVREIVKKADCATLVEPGNALELSAAIEELLKNEKRCMDLARKGRQYVVRHFDRQKITRKLLRVVNENS